MLPLGDRGRGSSRSGPPATNVKAITAEQATVATRVDCATTGKRQEADTVHKLWRAGRPVLVRYGLDATAAPVGDSAVRRTADLEGRERVMAIVLIGTLDRRAPINLVAL